MGKPRCERGSIVEDESALKLVQKYHRATLYSLRFSLGAPKLLFERIYFFPELKDIGFLKHFLKYNFLDRTTDAPRSEKNSLALPRHLVDAYFGKLSTYAGRSLSPRWPSVVGPQWPPTSKKPKLSPRKITMCTFG